MLPPHDGRNGGAAGPAGTRAVRLLWAGLGLLFLGIGLLGVVVPLLPTTPFLLLSAFCFARGSDRLHRWLTGHPRLGPPLEQWRRHRAISRQVKRNAIIAIIAVPPISLLFGAPLPVVGLQCIVLVFPATFILTRPLPPPVMAADASEQGCGVSAGRRNRSRTAGEPSPSHPPRGEGGGSG